LYPEFIIYFARVAAGVQRKLELDNQMKLESNHKLTKENAMNQPWSRLPPPVRSNGEYCSKIM
jgi:protein kinase